MFRALISFVSSLAGGLSLPVCVLKAPAPRVSRLTCLSLPLQPVFLQETSDCSYLFEWRTQYACPPFDVTECSFK